MKFWIFQYRNYFSKGTGPSTSTKIISLLGRGPVPIWENVYFYGKMSIFTGKMSIFTGKCKFLPGKCKFLRENIMITKKWKWKWQASTGTKKKLIFFRKNDAVIKFGIYFYQMLFSRALNNLKNCFLKNHFLKRFKISNLNSRKGLPPDFFVF